MVLEELTPKLLELAKSPYGHFVVSKLITTASKQELAGEVSVRSGSRQPRVPRSRPRTLSPDRLLHAPCVSILPLPFARTCTPHVHVHLHLRCARGNGPVITNTALSN